MQTFREILATKSLEQSSTLTAQNFRVKSSQAKLEPEFPLYPTFSATDPMLKQATDPNSAGQLFGQPLAKERATVGFGQLSLRTILVIVFVVAVNLAVFQRFPPSVGLATSFISMAVAMHVIASHFGRRAMNIGNAIGASERPEVVPESSRQIEFIEESPECLVKNAEAQTVQAPRFGSRNKVYLSGCLGIVAGPWICFEAMSRIDADVAHPLATFSICVAGALLGIAACLVAGSALRLFNAAIRSLRMIPPR